MKAQNKKHRITHARTVLQFIHMNLCTQEQIPVGSFGAAPFNGHKSHMASFPFPNVMTRGGR
jgi:hypothetical protein